MIIVHLMLTIYGYFCTHILCGKTMYCSLTLLDYVFTVSVNVYHNDFFFFFSDSLCPNYISELLLGLCSFFLSGIFLAKYMYACLQKIFD